jgi:hypothetical protein
MGGDSHIDTLTGRFAALADEDSTLSGWRPTVEMFVAWGGKATASVGWQLPAAKG